MNPSELKDLQAPIKARYRENPDTAVVTLRAQGTLADGVTCSVDTARTRRPDPWARPGAATQCPCHRRE